MKWYGTFGQGQLLAQNYVMVEAKNYVEAYAKMEEHYGKLWAFLYTELAFAGQPAQYDLTEVPLGTPNARKNDVPVELKIDDADVKISAEDGATSPLEPSNTNEFGIALTVGNEVVIQRPPAHSLTKKQAYELAAWLYVVASAIPGDLEFGDVVNAVEEQNAF